MRKNLILNFLEKHLLLTFAGIIQIAYQFFIGSEWLGLFQPSVFLLSAPRGG